MGLEAALEGSDEARRGQGREGGGGLRGRVEAVAEQSEKAVAKLAGADVVALMWH